MLKSKFPMRLLALVLLACMLIPCLGYKASAEDVSTADQEVQNGVTASWVRYRSYYSGTVIGCLENGTKLTIVGSTKRFYKIDCFEMKGYIAKEQVVQDAEGNYIVSCRPNFSETTILPTVSAEEALSHRNTIRSYAAKFLGVKYVWGGTSPWGFDCSGLTQYVFANSGYSLFRNCNTQMRNGVIIAKEDLQCGDLVFFENTAGNINQVATHVGIYIGNGNMIHSGGKGVQIEAIDTAYFAKRFLCARRIILTDSTQEVLTTPAGVHQTINSSFWRDGSQT